MSNTFEDDNRHDPGEFYDEMKEIFDKKEKEHKQALQLLREASTLIKISTSLHHRYWLEDYNEFKNKSK